MANLSDHSEFYLIDQKSYEEENVTRAEYLHRSSKKPWREEMDLIMKAIIAHTKNTVQ